MNVSCSICAELFRNIDANNLHVTRCGHVFHNVCLSKWLERKNTCPECRSKTTISTVIRLYVNIADSSCLENQSGAPDLVTLQNENDNLKFQILEKDGALKSKEETVKRLDDENKKIISGQIQSRNLVLALEQKLEQNKIIQHQHTDQIKHLRSRLTEIDQLKEQLKLATEKNRLTDIVQQVISGTQQETEELLREGRSMTELATMVTTLKRELKNNTVKRSQLRATVDDLTKQLRHCKEEKMQLEERCSILDSELQNFHMKNKKNDSIDKNSSSEDIENVNETTTNDLKKRTFNPQLTDSKRFNFKSELISKTKSPSLNIKASSIAGLSPLLKRTKSADLYKLSPNTNEPSETLSIMKKPRLIQTHTKKSDLRPQRLQMPSSKPIDFQPKIIESQPISSSTSTNTNSLTHKIGNIGSMNNRFRLGPLTKLK